MKTKTFLQMVALLIGFVSAIFWILFLYSFLVYVFSNPETGMKGDLAEAGLFLIKQIPVVAYSSMLTAIYFIYFIAKYDKI